MIQIDLHDYYPHHPKGSYVEVTEEIAITILDFERSEEAQRRRIYWNKAHYSLDLNDGIEFELLITALSPYELLEEKLIKEQLYHALEMIPQVQANRIRAYFFDGMSKSEIARREDVDRKSITESIDRGLDNLRKIFKNIF